MSKGERPGADDFKPVFATTSTFASTFPQIESAAVAVTHRESGLLRDAGEGANDWYTEKTLGEHVRCTNDLCYAGGFPIGNVLREMVSARETHREGRLLCRGNEGSPKGRRIYRKCLYGISYTIDLVYRS